VTKLRGLPGVSDESHYVRIHHFHITFDALLIGHDAGVTGVAWGPSLPRVLLTTSTDSSAILWSISTLGRYSDESTQLWTIHRRFGDVGGQRLGGFVGGLWVHRDQFCAWTWNGGLRRWHFLDDQWQEMSAITGHSSPVCGIDWEPAGRYLISAR